MPVLFAILLSVCLLAVHGAPIKGVQDQCTCPNQCACTNGHCTWPMYCKCECGASPWCGCTFLNQGDNGTASLRATETASGPSSPAGSPPPPPPPGNISVVVVRHGEKGPTSGGHLTPDGVTRSHYLATCFGRSNVAIRNPTDSGMGIVYADGGPKAQREKELMEPLKQAKHISFFQKCTLLKGVFTGPMHKCARDHIEEAQRQGKQTVLLSWEHVDIPHLVGYLIGGQHAAWPPTCGSWNGDSKENMRGNTAGCYDRIWKFNYEHGAVVEELDEGFMGSSQSCNVHHHLIDEISTSV